MKKKLKTLAKRVKRSGSSYLKRAKKTVKRVVTKKNLKFVAEIVGKMLAVTGLTMILIVLEMFRIGSIGLSIATLWLSQVISAIHDKLVDQVTRLLL